MLRLTSVISSLKLIQSISMRPGFLRLEMEIKILFPGLELNFGTQFLTNFVNSPKEVLKKNFHDFLLSIMEAEDDFAKVPVILEKNANSASSMH